MNIEYAGVICHGESGESKHTRRKDLGELCLNDFIINRKHCDACFVEIFL